MAAAINFQENADRIRLAATLQATVFSAFSLPSQTAYASHQMVISDLNAQMQAVDGHTEEDVLLVESLMARHSKATKIAQPLEAMRVKAFERVMAPPLSRS